MNRERMYCDILEKARRSKCIAFLLSPLFIFSFLFWVGTQVRKAFLKRKECRFPVVTVGNISFGGTGKTPFILHLLKYLPDSVAYVSRGYGRMEKEPFVGKGSLCTYEACGDEAMLVATRFPRITISIAKDKWNAIQHVPEGVRLILLDDGLQRYDIPKKVEIATVDVQNPDGYGALFPRGLLREPLSRLETVDYIVLTNLPQRAEPESIKEEYEKKFHKPTLVVRPKIARFFSRQGETKEIQGPVALFSSIASPRRARELMERAGFCVVDHLVLQDHADVKERILEDYCKRVKERFPDAVLVGTEKDYVKKRTWPSLPLPLLFSEVGIEVVAGAKEFEDMVASLLEKEEKHCCE